MYRNTLNAYLSNNVSNNGLAILSYTSFVFKAMSKQFEGKIL